MESLLASYASDSGEEAEETEREQEQEHRRIQRYAEEPGRRGASFWQARDGRSSASESPEVTTTDGRYDSARRERKDSAVRSGLFSLPPPRNSKLGASATRPEGGRSEFGAGKEGEGYSEGGNEFSASGSGAPSSIFASLPRPKSNAATSREPVKSQKTIAFKPPIDTRLLNQLSDEEEEPTKKKIKTSGGTGGASGILGFLPAPKHARGSAPVLGSGFGSSSRRISLDSTPSSPSLPSPSSSVSDSQVGAETKTFANAIPSVIGVDASGFPSIPPQHSMYASQNLDSQAHHSAYPPDQSYAYQQTSEAYYASDAAYGPLHQPSQYSQHPQNPYSESSVAHPVTDHAYFTADNANAYYTPGNAYEEPTDPLQKVLANEKKRHGKVAPTNVLEVKQADLTKKGNLREDQSRATGIAFGPSYQPVATGKDKPSKVHRRKHQIGSLFYDMKQKEMELMERRSRGMLTKSETQAKYGW